MPPVTSIANATPPEKLRIPVDEILPELRWEPVPLITNVHVFEDGGAQQALCVEEAVDDVVVILVRDGHEIGDEALCLPGREEVFRLAAQLGRFIAPISQE
jgi:hypothetical protein